MSMTLITLKVKVFYEESHYYGDINICTGIYEKSS